MSNFSFKKALNQFGLPRIIIVSFFLLLLVSAGAFQMDLMQLLSDCVRRWGMYGILTLAMVPAVQCGIGLNFGISMGIVGGLLGSDAFSGCSKPYVRNVGISPSGDRHWRCACSGNWLALRTSLKPGKGF